MKSRIETEHLTLGGACGAAGMFGLEVVAEGLPPFPQNRLRLAFGQRPSLVQHCLGQPPHLFPFFCVQGLRFREDGGRPCFSSSCAVRQSGSSAVVLGLTILLEETLLEPCVHASMLRALVRQRSKLRSARRRTLNRTQLQPPLMWFAS